MKYVAMLALILGSSSVWAGYPINTLANNAVILIPTINMPLLEEVAQNPEPTRGNCLSIGVVIQQTDSITQQLWAAELAGQMSDDIVENGRKLYEATYELEYYCGDSPLIHKPKISIGEAVANVRQALDKLKESVK